MALDPETIIEERAKILQFETNGTIVSSKLIEKDECTPKYESVLYTGAEKITFQYRVYGDEICTIDSIYAIKDDPFPKDSKITVILTQEKPYYMISSDINFTPEIQMITNDENISSEPSTESVSYIFVVGLILLLSIAIIFILNKKVLKKNKK